MERRGFIGGLLAGMAGFLGIGSTQGDGKPVGPPDEGESAMPLPFINVRWRLLMPSAPARPWKPEDVSFWDVHCGACTCPPGPIEEGFRAIILTARHRYCIVARNTDSGGTYLGCTMSSREPLPGETWTRGSDLADGKCTLQTWQRIVADIERVERTGSKYTS